MLQILPCRRLGVSLYSSMVEEIGTKTAGACAGPHNRGSIPMTGASNSASSNLDAVTCVEISDPAVMSKQPMVSVRMTTYNHEPYIARAIEGVLMQKTSFPIELIIGEDCSVDHTRDIVLEYQRRHPDVIRVVLWGKNVGMRANGRKVRELQRGKYIAWCEGDDYWTHPKKLQMQVDIMEENPDVGLVYGRRDWFDVRTQRLVKPRQSKMPATTGQHNDVFTDMVAERVEHPLTCTVCMRKEILEAVLRDNAESFRMGFVAGDTLTWLEASRVTRFEKIDESVAVHTLQVESVSRSANMGKTLRFCKSGYELYLHLIRKYGCSPELERIVHERCNRMLLMLAYGSRDWETAGQCADKLLQIGATLGVRDRLMLLGSRQESIRPVIAAIVASRPMQAAYRALSYALKKQSLWL